MNPAPPVIRNRAIPPGSVKALNDSARETERSAGVFDLALKGPESASIFRRGSGDDVETGTTVQDLSRVISPEGRQLLQHHNLLRPLIEKMVIDETTAAAVVTDEKLAEAKLGLLKRRGLQLP